jgi:hypothetical protein
MMFTRTEKITTSDHDNMDLDNAMCPPHAFDQGWGLAHGEEIHADTVPVMFCGSCGEIRLMRVPE